MMQLVKKDYGNKVLALCELANNREKFINTAAKCANAYNKKLMLQRIQQRQQEVWEEVLPAVR